MSNFPLPTGPAGTPNPSALTIQGIANGTPMAVTPSLPAGAAQDGTDATGVSQLTGGAGIRGWLSGCYKVLGQLYTAVTGTLTVSGTVALSGGTSAIGSVMQAGSTGVDYSVNAATVPLGGFVLLATIPASPTRAYCEVQNQSAGTLQMVRDDGNGTNQSTVLLGAGGAGLQGAGWSSPTFKGRIRVYGATGAQVSAFQD